MTFQLELDAESAARLQTQAALLGIPPEQLLGELVSKNLQAQPARPGSLTTEEFHAMLRELAEGSESLPKLPTSAFSRDSIYDEHP